jgi:RNA polymerase sigma-70 factor, ECF subfamily
MTPQTQGDTRTRPTAAGERPAAAPPVHGLSDALLAELYRESGAEKYGLSVEYFAQILREVGARYLTGDLGEAECGKFFESLHVEELALARACSKGIEEAWEIFLTRYREKLYSAANSIAREESAARELADSLYAELYGMRTVDGQRISKLHSYTGRGSLEGWLRTVLGQEYVNRYRSQRRLVSLDEQTEAGSQLEAHKADTPLPPDPRLEMAADEALVSLGEEEKFIIASYYLDGRTLGEIARMLGVHESTISRKLEKIISALRKRITRGLVKRGMSSRQASEALEADVRDLTVNVRQRLMQESGQEPVP